MSRRGAVILARARALEADVIRRRAERARARRERREAREAERAGLVPPSRPELPQ